MNCEIVHWYMQIKPDRGKPVKVLMEFKFPPAEDEHQAMQRERNIEQAFRELPAMDWRMYPLVRRLLGAVKDCISVRAIDRQGYGAEASAE